MLTKDAVFIKRNIQGYEQMKENLLLTESAQFK